MKNQILIVGIMLVLLVVGLSGCITSDDVTADDIAANMLQAVEDVASYKYSVSGTITQTTTNESGTFTTEQPLSQSSEVDIANKRLKIDYTYTAPEPLGDQHLIYYIVNDIMYTGTEIDGNVTWISYDTSSTDAIMIWIAYSQLERQAVTLEKADVEKLADETVDDIECYVLGVIIDFQSQFSGDVPPIDVPSSWDPEMDINYWIAKDTSLLMKVHLKATMDLTSVFGLPGDDSVIQVQEMEMLFSDYNVPVTIELPPEATQEP